MGYGVGGEGQLRDRLFGDGGLPLAIYNVFQMCGFKKSRFKTASIRYTNECEQDRIVNEHGQ